jgi:hypothetical protein
VCGERAEHLEVEGISPVPAADRAGGQRQFRSGHDAFWIEELDDAETIAFRAGAQRAVERENPRFEFRQRIRADRAGKPGGKEMLALAVHLVGNGTAIGMTQCGFERFGETLADVFANPEPVNDHVDAVFVRLGESGDGIDFVNLAVNPQPGKTLRPQVGNQLKLLTFALGDHRREDHQPASRRQRQHVIDHLRHRLCCERLLVFRAVWRAGAGEEQTQVIVDFGDCADRRARVVTGRLLLDRDRRRESLDQIDIGFLHALQKLSRIGRQRLDIAALSFGVQGIESQRRLA